MLEEKGKFTIIRAIARLKGWHWVVISLFVSVGLVLILFSRWHGIPIHPLPSDEVLIAHFTEHRADIETLVRSYRSFRPTPENKVWDKQPEARELMQRASVKRLNEVGPTWFPHPYSIEGVEQFRALPKSKTVTAWDLLPYRSITVTRQHDSMPYLLFVPDGTRLVFKRLVYMPEVPKIEDGKLWEPVDVDGKLKQGDRVFPSLDNFPPDWKRGECVYRPLDPHWFISMCAE